MRPPRTAMSRGGGGRGRGPGRSPGRGRGRSFGNRVPEGPPERVEEIGSVIHACEGDLVCSLTKDEKIPYFNASIFVDKDTKIGKVDEVFGPINAVMFTVKPDVGVVATSFRPQDKVCIDPAKLLPLSRFTNPPPMRGGSRGRGGGRSAGRGGRSPMRGRGPMARGRYVSFSCSLIFSSFTGVVAASRRGASSSSFSRVCCNSLLLLLLVARLLTTAVLILLPLRPDALVAPQVQLG